MPLYKLKMKPFSKLTSHRLCQQLKCPQTVLAQSVDRLHCGRSLVWGPGPDLYSESLKKNSERKVLPLFCGLASPTRRQNSVLNKYFGAKYIDTNRAFFKVIPRLFPACDQALRAGMGKLSSSHASFYPCLCNPVYILNALRGLNLRFQKYNQFTKVKITERVLYVVQLIKPSEIHSLYMDSLMSLRWVKVWDK